MSKIVLIGNIDVGMYKFRKELITELAKSNEVCVVVPAGDYCGKLGALGVRVINIELNRHGMNPLADLALYRKYRALLAELRPDLVITYTIKPNIYGGMAARSLSIPYAVNITGLGTTFQKRGPLRALVSSLYRFALSRVRVVFFENEENREVFLKHRIVDVSVTHRLNGAGVNIHEFDFKPYPPDDNRTNFLFIGRIMREKGVDELFESAFRLKMEGYNIIVDMIGWFEEDYRDSIKPLEDEGIISYHGFQEDVRPFIEGCACSVLPSYHEGMSNTLLESAAMGRPLITSRIHGCMEAVDDGISGMLCEVQNTESLYDVMRQFVNLPYDDKRKMGEMSRRHAVKYFSKESVVEDTIAHLGL